MKEREAGKVTYLPFSNQDFLFCDWSYCFEIVPWLNFLNCNSVGGDAQDTVILYPHLATMYMCTLLHYQNILISSLTDFLSERFQN